MRSIKIFIGFACIAITVIASVAFTNTRSGKAPKEDSMNKGFAVIELFTSEGCSSCPPADALVARVQKESNDKPVYILAFHVDYWNRLGWKDVFSNADYSDRQRQYAHWLKLSSVYTPQVIVNGRTELIGSEESKLHDAIKSNLEKPAKSELALSEIKVTGDKASLKYTAEGAANNASVLIALIQKTATTKVQAGENGGRTLSHVQIVNKLQSVSLKNGNSGTENIALPRGFNPQNWELIGFIQNTANGEIEGAAKAAFPSTVSANAK
jgi:hypothetical protein